MLFVICVLYSLWKKKELKSIFHGFLFLLDFPSFHAFVSSWKALKRLKKTSEMGHNHEQWM